MKKLHFSTWDGMQTFCMYGSFMPIFQETAEKKKLKLNVLKFSWGTITNLQITEQKVKELMINFITLTILRKSNANLGRLFTIFSSKSNMIKLKRIEERKNFGERGFFDLKEKFIVKKYITHLENLYADI